MQADVVARPRRHYLPASLDVVAPRRSSALAAGLWCCPPSPSLAALFAGGMR